MGNWLRKGKTIERKCDCCGNLYNASPKRLERNWDKCCGVTCSSTLKAAHRKRLTKYRPKNARSKIKEIIRERDKHTCQVCKKTQEFPRLEVHRIVPEKDGGIYSLENCITVCKSCHKKIEPIK